MGQGAYKTLVAMLKAAPSMSGTSVFFGEEYQHAEEGQLPMVVIWPKDVTFPPTSFPGYAEDSDVNLDNLWTLNESCEIECWGARDPNANPPPSPVDDCDAVEDIRVNVLRALMSQEAPDGQKAKGLRFVPTGGRWATFNDQVLRYGRAFVFTVAFDVTYTTTPPVYAEPPIALELETEIEA